MFFLVTGASGVGKSTVRKLIELEFADVLEATELGMLGSTPRWEIEWRHRMVDHRHRPEVITQNGWPPMRWDRWVGLTAPTPWSSHVIETSELSLIEVAQRVAQWLRRLLRANLAQGRRAQAGDQAPSGLDS